MASVRSMDPERIPFMTQGRAVARVCLSDSPFLGRPCPTDPKLDQCRTVVEVARLQHLPVTARILQNCLEHFSPGFLLQARAERNTLSQQLIQVSTQAAQASGSVRSETARVQAMGQELLSSVATLQVRSPAALNPLLSSHGYGRVLKSFLLVLSMSRARSTVTALFPRPGSIRWRFKPPGGSAS